MAETPERLLASSFERNGCLRVPNPERRKNEPRSYKMGYEIRLVATSKRELRDLRRAIRACGFKPGSPFTKVNRWIQPIYGRQAMESLAELLEKLGHDADVIRDRLEECSGEASRSVADKR